MNRVQKRIVRHRTLKIGIAIFISLVIVALIGPLLVGDAGLTPQLERHLLSPREAGRLGYGVNGIDVMTWLVYGARISLIVSLSTTVICIVVGTITGAVAGYFGGRIDAALMRVIDIILAFPGLLLALYLAAVMPPSIFTMIFALSATGWVSYARLIRARVYEIKHRDFVIAATALGASHTRVIMTHILPNIVGPVIVQASYGLSVIIIAEAGLSFLGLGLPIGTPSWGALLDQGVAHLFSSSYLAIFPGLAIAITVLGFNFIGDGFRDVLDPKAKLY